MQDPPDWIAVDWGTSACRAWAMTSKGGVLAEARSDRGMNTLAREDYEAALLDMIAPWQAEGAPVLACGMLGSRQGWVEAPYVTVPATADDLTVTPAPTRRQGLSVGVVGGVKQDLPADVMRGEETQVAGFLSQNPGFDGVICLPGTHCKWVLAKGDGIEAFRTAMTGEIFALLTTQSVLRHAVADGWRDEEFEDAVAEGLARPEALAAALFALRARSLLEGLGGEAVRSRVSGLLIGGELAAMRDLWLGREVAVVGADRLAGTYAAALRLQGATPTVAQGDAMTRAGLARIRDRLETA